MNTQQTLLSTSSCTSTNQPIESPSITQQTPVNYPNQTPINYQSQTPIPNTGMTSRSSNKSFSNRLGTIMLSNQIQNSSAQEPKPNVQCHQYIPQTTKSPTPVKQEIVIPVDKHQNASTSNEISTSQPPKPKCKYFYFLLIHINLY